MFTPSFNATLAHLDDLAGEDVEWLLLGPPLSMNPIVLVWDLSKYDPHEVLRLCVPIMRTYMNVRHFEEVGPLKQELIHRYESLDVIDRRYYEPEINTPEGEIA